MNLLADTFQFLLKDFLTVTKSAGRFTPHNFCWHIFWQSLHMPADLPPPQFLLEDFMTVNKSTGRFTPQFLLANFSDSHQICQHLVTKSSGRFTPQNFCWQIFWHSPNLLVDSLLADYLTGRFGQPAGRYLPISAGIFSDSHQICWQIPFWQIYWLADLVNLLADTHQYLLADFLTVTKSAGRFTLHNSAGRFSDTYQICCQI